MRVDVHAPSGTLTVSTLWAWNGAQQMKNVTSTATDTTTHHQLNFAFPLSTGEFTVV